VVFVRHGLPGEVVVAEVTERTARYLRADAVEILEPAAERVVPRCPLAGPGGCGGCDYQHSALAAQRDFKSTLIATQLRRVAGLDLPVEVEGLPGDDGFSWRTRVRFSVDETGALGFHRHRDRTVVATPSCPIAAQGIEALGLEQWRWNGADSVEVTAHPSGDAAVVACTSRRGHEIDLPRIAGVGFSVDGEVRQRPAHTHIAIAGRRFAVSAGGFFQVHRAAAAVLHQAVLELAQVGPGDVAVDLYSGVGLFASALADLVGPKGKVVAVERDAVAAETARTNLADLPQVDVVTGDAGRLEARGIRPAVVVCDPARRGLGRHGVDKIVELAPRRILSVSCDPATFARDLALLSTAGYQLTALRAIDLFPQTEHVELIGTLEQR